MWYSPGFYTSRGGYKIALKVFPNGDSKGHGTHLSLYVSFMSGEYDDLIEWPFRGEIKVKLLNQAENSDHHKGIIEYNRGQGQGNRRVTGSVYGVGYGQAQFISHRGLIAARRGCHYLCNDTIYFRVKAVVMSHTKSWLCDR